MTKSKTDVAESEVHAREVERGKEFKGEKLEARKRAVDLLDGPEWDAAPVGSETEVRLLTKAFMAYATQIRRECAEIARNYALKIGEYHLNKAIAAAIEGRE